MAASQHLYKIHSWQDKHLAEIYMIIESALNNYIDIDYFIINKLQIKDTVLFAPCPRLSFIKFGEFIFIDTYFINFSTSQQHNYLNGLISVLYREQLGNATDDDVRIAFNQSRCKKNEALIDTVSYEMRYIIYLNYLLLRKEMEKHYPHVFKAEGTDGDGGDGWLAVRNAMVEKPTELENLDNCYLSDVLYFLDNQIKQQKQYAKSTS